MNDALSRLNRFSIDLSMLPVTADLEEFVVKQLLDITGGEGAVFTEYDPVRRQTTVKHVQVERRMLDRVVQLLGRQLIGFQAPVSDETYSLLTTGIARVTKTLNEASFGSISRPVGAAVQALLDVDRFIGIAYLVEGSLYGTSLVAMRKGKPDPPLDLLKNFSFLVALALRRKEAEAALRQSEERHRLLADNATDVIWTMDTEGNFTYVSPSVEKLRGFTPTEVMAQPFSAALMPESAGVALAALAEAIEALRAGRAAPEFRGELEQPCKDGSVVWTDQRVTDMRDASGKWIGFLGVSRDITKRKRVEAGLKASESRYRTVVDNIHEGILVVSESAVLYHNNRILEMFGYTAEELAGLEFGARLHPDDREGALQRLSSAIESSTRGPDFELRFLTKTDDVIWVRANSSVIVWEGEPAIIVFLQDSTEHKRAQADQEMSREVLQILNEPGDLIGSVGRVIATIKAGTGFEAVGIRLEQGEDFPYFVQEGFPADFLQTENTLLERDEQGGPVRAADGSVRLEGACGLVISGKGDPAGPLFTKGGSFWINDASLLAELPPADDPRSHPRNHCIHAGYASIALVPIRDKERIVGLLHLADPRKGRLSLEAVGRLEGMAAHIGAAVVRKEAEAALRESQERYRTLVNVSPDAIVVDADGIYAFANPAAARLFGADSPQELVGRRVMDRVHPDFRGLVAQRAAQADAGAVTAPREITLVRLDGSTVEVEASAARIEFDGRRGNQVVLRDITERKLAEAKQRDLEHQLQERQKLESLGVLAGGIAHDFNNMLTAILGYSDMILADGRSLPEETLSDVSEIKHAAERAKALTGAILAFSRRQPREPRILALSSLVAGLEPLLRRTLGEDIDLVCDLSAEAPPVEIDPSQFTQVLMNLVVNARDAMPSGGVLTVKVGGERLGEECLEISPALSPGDWTVLGVSDTGSGIDAAIVARIFEPFFTTKGPGEGTGLGLSTAYGIVKQSGGDIVVRSEPGKGTTFAVYLPRGQAGGEPGAEPGATVSETTGAGPEREVEERAVPHGAGKAVLLVEDEPAVRKLSTRLLKERGYAVLVASDGPEALDLARDASVRIDLLLTDVVLPGPLQGDALVRSILEERPGLRVIFMSGYPRDAILRSGRLDEGMSYLEKPFTADALVGKVREALGHDA